MNDDKDKKDKSNSLASSLVVPILIALIAGGTAPWWIDLFRDNEDVSEPVTSTETERDHASQMPRELQDDDSLEIHGTNNTVNDNSVNAQSNGNQTVVSGTGSNVVQGTGNNIVQGTGNQLTVQQESDARSRGEFAIPAISGLSYHEAREILIKEGWIPLTQRHLYPQEEPSLQYGTARIFWDLGYWEVVSCSGTAEGFCRFEFSDPSSRKLVVVTAGMEDPSIPAQAMVNRVFFDEENSP
ncbi:hypothetical protein [Vacuolonema iberomarrocanum]|uniref:hypothetical protein n=1 Tax=Vacuolonema iberomarrocanum TaxID=3454632 RepID=UPI001A00AB78|nr:hypothetical protein [filamentous cyanobacterium LEGE 07170]